MIFDPPVVSFPWLGRRQLSFDTCKIAPPLAGLIFFLVLFVVYDAIIDVAPPFEYLENGSSITCPPTNHTCVQLDTAPPRIEAEEGTEVMRHRNVFWRRSGCDVTITGHVLGPFYAQPDGTARRDEAQIDEFEVSSAMQPVYLREAAAGRPHAFSKDMPVIVPRNPVTGEKHYGQMTYFSIDYYRCNWPQRHLWFLKDHPSKIIGPMMNFNARPARGADAGPP